MQHAVQRTRASSGYAAKARSDNEKREKYFNERRQLIRHWFERLTDDQRMRLLGDLMSISTSSSSWSASDFERLAESISISLSLSAPSPTSTSPMAANQRVDFAGAAVLPLKCVLQIFSYVDPRSLCRCARVSGYWRWLSERDEIWRPKCLKLGWCLASAPTPFEHGVWKANYAAHFLKLKQFGILQDKKSISIPPPPTIPLPHPPTHRVMIKNDRGPVSAAIQIAKPKEKERVSEGEVRRGASSGKAVSSTVTTGRSSKETTKCPWRVATRFPTDIWRLNYLDDRDQNEVNYIVKRPLLQQQLYTINAIPTPSLANPKVKRLKIRSTARKSTGNTSDSLSLSWAPSSRRHDPIAYLERLAELTNNDISVVESAEMLFVRIDDANRHAVAREKATKNALTN